MILEVKEIHCGTETVYVITNKVGKDRYYFGGIEFGIRWQSSVFDRVNYYRSKESALSVIPIIESYWNEN